MRILLVGTSHRVADADVRERMHVDLDEVYGALSRIRGAQGVLEEAVPLHTCGRMELYGVAADPDRAVRLLRRLTARHTGLSRADLDRNAYVRCDADAVRHLFRVSAGLDSVIHGEAQIIGQVRDAAHHPRARGTMGPVLHRLFQHALTAGKRVRSETGIGRGAASLASASVALLRREVGDLAPLSVLVIGAGATGALMARLLTKAGVARVVVANRTLERAEWVAGEVGGEARSLSAIGEALREADLVVGAAAAPQPIVTADAVAALAAEVRPRYFLDLAHPRSFDAALANVPGVAVFDLEQVFRRVEEARQARAAHLPRARELVEEEALSFETWHRSRESAAVVRAVRQRTLERAMTEAEKHSGKASEEERERMRRLARSVARAILHQPTVALRDVDPSSDRGRTLLEHASALFGVDAPEDPMEPTG